MSAAPSASPPRPLLAVGLAALLAAGLAVVQQGEVLAGGRDADRPALHTQAVGVTASGDRVGLDATSMQRLVADTRALDPGAARAQRAWLAEGSVPGSGGPWADMGRDALLDLHVLTLGNGAALAGWSPHWRYVWPRDAAFVVAALARTGHTEDAERVLTFLQQVRPAQDAAASGGFQARYLPDGSGRAPDGRGVEADGAGWVLWATAVLADAVPQVDRTALLTRLAPLLSSATRACLTALDRGGGLPPPGLDYWEVPDRRVSLGLAAPILAGLEAAPPLLAGAGRPDLADQARTAAAALAATIAVRFGAYGYPRYADGPDGAPRDAALTLLLPPFRATGSAAEALMTAWSAAQVELRRPAGGLAPGAAWRADGVSWTPETALFALTAAHTGRRAVANGWLSWLDTHRTRAGALPEKVLADGSPAAVAPLAWTAALVVLTLDAM